MENNEIEKAEQAEETEKPFDPRAEEPKPGSDLFVESENGPARPFVPKKGGTNKRDVPEFLIKSNDPSFVNRTQDAIEHQRKIRIKIPSTETMKDDVFVSVNGVNRLIKRDTVVELEKAFIDALNNATMTVYTQTKRPDGEGYDMVPKEIMRFPYQVVL